MAHPRGELKCGGTGEGGANFTVSSKYCISFKKILTLLNYCLFVELAGLGLFIQEITYLFIYERC